MKNSLRPRLILIFCILLALASGQTFAAGEFQKARDGKTMIWNWQAKAGDTADWSGGRDKDGYATGFGDLTLYNTDGKTFGLFYGKMAHGKFEGAVNVHTGSRISHAYFVDGDRVTTWARGAAKSNMTDSEAAVVEQKKVEAEKEAAKKEKLANAEAEKEAAKKEKLAKAEAEKAAAEKEKVARAEAEKAVAKKEKVARAEPVATPTATPKKEQPTKIAKAATPTATPKKEQPKIAKAEAAPPAEKAARGPESYHKQAAEKPTGTNVAEEKSEPLSAEKELKRTEPAIKKTFTEPTPLPKAATEAQRSEPLPLPTLESSEAERAIKEPSSPAVQETPPVLQEPTTERTPEVAENKSETTNTAPDESRNLSNPPAAKETPADVSVNSLVGPPSSLRAIPESPSSEKSQTERESAPKSDAPLNETDVVKLADTEARIQGAPLDNYDRPKVDHSQVKGKWTLFYAPKKGDSSGDLPSFSVTVEDKSRKVDLRK